MVKGTIGKAKAGAAMRRRLDRGARKAARKAKRQAGYWVTQDGGTKIRPCSIYAEFGRHNNGVEYDGSWYCYGCFRDARRWFGEGAERPVNPSEDYPYHE